MGDPRKFFFDLNNFDQSAAERERQKQKEEEPPPPPTFSEEELEAAKKQAYDEGYKVGRQDEKETREQEASQNLQQISQSLSGLFSSENERTEMFMLGAINLTCHSLDRAFPQIVQQVASKEIKSFLEVELDKLRQMPGLKIYVHPDISDLVKGHFETIRERFAHQGSWTFLDDKTLAVAECRVEWDGGGVEYSLSSLVEGIVKVFKDVLGEDLSPVPIDEKPKNAHNEGEAEEIAEVEVENAEASSEGDKDE